MPNKNSGIKKRLKRKKLSKKAFKNFIAKILREPLSPYKMKVVKNKKKKAEQRSSLASQKNRYKNKLDD